MRPVGFVGLGDMGRPMAERLLDRGHPLVVYDLRADVLAELAERGATPAADLHSLAKQCDLIFVCVVTDEQVFAVMDELAATLSADAVVAVVSSVLPATMTSVAERLQVAGAHVVDAPVTGSRPAAAAGTLTVMLGGSPEIADRIRPVLDAFAAQVIHVGPTGAAQAVKIANNVMLHMNHLVALEALEFAQAHGLSERAVIEVANAGTGRSWVTETWGLIDGMFLDHPQAGTDGIYDMMVKEMWHAVELSKVSRTPLPLTGLGVQVSRGLLERRAAAVAADRSGS